MTCPCPHPSPVRRHGVMGVGSVFSARCGRDIAAHHFEIKLEDLPAHVICPPDPYLPRADPVTPPPHRALDPTEEEGGDEVRHAFADQARWLLVRQALVIRQYDGRRWFVCMPASLGMRSDDCPVSLDEAVDRYRPAPD